MRSIIACVLAGSALLPAATACAQVLPYQVGSDDRPRRLPVAVAGLAVVVARPCAPRSAPIWK
ncbi:hypothetical protein ACFS32_16870 [Novosphingobium pokkalii]|uniref:hypothetical protein n=1 Tax=Novosphingobium pokkalii TaxID=1770194 RepID=UPI003637125C